MAVRLVGRRLSEAVGLGAQYALRPARRLLNLLDADGGVPAAGRCDRRLLLEAHGRHSPCAVSTALMACEHRDSFARKQNDQLFFLAKESKDCGTSKCLMEYLMFLVWYFLVSLVRLSSLAIR